MDSKVQHPNKTCVRWMVKHEQAGLIEVDRGSFPLILDPNIYRAGFLCVVTGVRIPFSSKSWSCLVSHDLVWVQVVLATTLLWWYSNQCTLKLVATRRKAYACACLINVTHANTLHHSCMYLCKCPKLPFTDALELFTVISVFKLLRRHQAPSWLETCARH